MIIIKAQFHIGLFNKFTMDNTDITKYSSIKLGYLFCIIGITYFTSV